MASAKTSQAELGQAALGQAESALNQAALDQADLAESSQIEPVSATELNSWRRGFTPQAEIWNGRLAMLGLSLGLAVLLIARLSFS
jgi:hypothetical protein